MNKKLINSIVASVLLVVCVVLFAFRGNDYIAHAGLRANESIDNMGELYEVVDLVSGGLNSGNIQESPNYKSATLHMTVSETIKVEQEYQSKEAAEKITIEQDITCYLAKEGMYIEAQSAIFTSAKNEFEYESEPVRAFGKYNVHVYLAEENAYINVIDYNVASDVMSMVIKPQYVNKWIEGPRETALGFLTLGEEMEFTLDTFAMLFKALLDGGDINESDTSVFFDKGELVHVEVPGAEELVIDYDDYKENFKIDISDKTRPYILLSAIYDNEKDIPVNPNSYHYHNLKSTLKTKLAMGMEIVISNVNNTEINWNVSDRSMVGKIESPEDIERLFEIKIYKEVSDGNPY